MWTTTDSGKVGSNASLVMSETSVRFSSNLCSRVISALHFRMKLVVGTSNTCPAYVLNAYLPGSSGSCHTPRQPRPTSSPCRYSSPEMSCPCLPTYDTTTLTCPTGTTVLLISSTVAN